MWFFATPGAVTSAPEYNQLLFPEVAPRVIKVLNSAETLADRKLIESAYGVDLGQGKAVVVEFMIPRSAMTPMERQEMEVEMASGKTCRIGFAINDNDRAGSDALNPVLWPITYATFERPDRLSLATFSRNSQCPNELKFSDSENPSCTGNRNDRCHGG